jgi:small subunit ribosomal protein S6e
VKVVIADPKNGKCYQIELDATKSKPLFGMRIGKEVDGVLLGLGGYKLEITGGTDKDGFPMRKDVHGVERTKILLSGRPGFRKTEKGERRKKTIRGNTVAEDIAQVNLKVTGYGNKAVAELLGVEPKPVEGEAKEVEKPTAETKETEADEKPPEENKADKPRPEEKTDEQSSETSGN